jgi:hypothetical protein
LGRQVEEQFAAGTLERHEAQLIDDQKNDFMIALLQRGEPPLVACLNQTLHQVGGPGKVNSEPTASTSREVVRALIATAYFSAKRRAKDAQSRTNSDYCGNGLSFGL